MHTIGILVTFVECFINQPNMNRINIPNSSYADCPIRMILSRISDKWSILTLFTLTQAPVMRFNELQKTIPDISQKMLTVTLRTLEEDGL